MRRKIALTTSTDIAVWVTKDAFFANVDPEDLACRDSQEVSDWYHPDWFFTSSNNLYFTPPAFICRNGRLYGIDGRHRAFLLFRHLEVIPMLLVLPDTWPEAKLAEIIHQEISEGEEVELPDLPIKTELAREVEVPPFEGVPSVEIKINL